MLAMVSTLSSVGGEQLRGELHAQEDDVVHGAAAEFAAAEAAQVLGAEVAAAGEEVERPRFAEARGDVLPQVAEAVVGLPRAGKALDVGVDDFDPVANRGGRVLAVDFVVEAEHGVAQGQRIEPGDGRRVSLDDGFLIGRLLIADPGDVPAMLRFAMKSERGRAAGQCRPRRRASCASGHRAGCARNRRRRRKGRCRWNPCAPCGRAARVSAVATWAMWWPASAGHSWEMTFRSKVSGPMMWVSDSRGVGVGGTAAL